MQFEMKRRVCLVDTGSGYLTTTDTQHADDARADNTLPDSWTRVSEWQEVEFTARKPAEFVDAKLATLAEQEKRVRAEFQKAIDHITNERGKLLALTAHAESDGGDL